MSDLHISVGVAINHFARGMNRLIRNLNYFSIRIKRTSVVNNQNRRMGKPMYRTRAFLKALQNKRR